LACALAATAKHISSKNVKKAFIITTNKHNHKYVFIVVDGIVIFAPITSARMARLSVNINKIATLRNSRGGDNPNLVQVAKDCERFGAQGITVHPRPDERHIRYQDVFDLKKIVTTEFNIEGNCQEQKFIDLVLANQPEQVTLVPDVLGQITSNHGWDTIKNQQYLKDIIKVFKNAGIRVSIFVDPVTEMVEAAATTGTDRIELYTEAYAHNYAANKEEAIAPYVKAAQVAHKLGIGINAGHDLDLQNLQYFAQNIPALDEVSIGHALISDALYYGLENTIQMYLRQLV
jgi:pyridoxine 5-phosphate synthase